MPKNIPKNQTIVIENVDVALLEKQRRVLATVLLKSRQAHCLRPALSTYVPQITDEEIDALAGLLNMLEAWSDKQYFERKGGKSCTPQTNPQTFPHPCTRCGFCCLNEICPTGKYFYGRNHRVCPGLHFNESEAACKLFEFFVKKPTNPPKQTQGLSLQISDPEGLFGIGIGCCIKARAIKDGVTYDFAGLDPEIKRMVALNKRAKMILEKESEGNDGPEAPSTMP